MKAGPPGVWSRRSGCEKAKGPNETRGLAPPNSTAPGQRLAPTPKWAGALMRKTTNKFPPEVSARAVRMVLDHAADHPLSLVRGVIVFGQDWLHGA